MNKNEYYSNRPTPYSSVPISPSGAAGQPERERGRVDGFFEAPHFTDARVKSMQHGLEGPSSPARVPENYTGKSASFLTPCAGIRQNSDGHLRLQELWRVPLPVFLPHFKSTAIFRSVTRH
jgi:hypothetical protein